MFNFLFASDIFSWHRLLRRVKDTPLEHSSSYCSLIICSAHPKKGE